MAHFFVVWLVIFALRLATGMTAFANVSASDDLTGWRKALLWAGYLNTGYEWGIAHSFCIGISGALMPVIGYC